MRPLLPLPGLLVFALWIAGEIVLFNLVAGWTGGALAFFLLVMKSVLGVVFVKRALTRKLFDMLRRGGAVYALEGAAATEAWLKGVGAALLVAPGFLTGIGGLALLTPRSGAGSWPAAAHGPSTRARSSSRPRNGARYRPIRSVSGASRLTPSSAFFGGSRRKFGQAGPAMLPFE